MRVQFNVELQATAATSQAAAILQAAAATSQAAAVLQAATATLQAAAAILQAAATLQAAICGHFYHTNNDRISELNVSCPPVRAKF